jgi:hypothetical protein
VFWFILAHFVTFLVDLLAARRADDRDKDVQILVLRHQVRVRCENLIRRDDPG